MLAATDAAIAALHETCGKPVDLREAMQRLALDIAGRTMFSFELEKHGTALRGFVNDYGDRLAQPRLLRSGTAGRLAGAQATSPAHCSGGDDASCARRSPSATPRAKRRRRAMSATSRTICSTSMVAARDPETSEAFSDEQLGDQVSTMILAGHETSSATALFWSLYLLALDPATQNRAGRGGEGRAALPARSTSAKPTFYPRGP